MIKKNFHQVPNSWNLEDCFIQNTHGCIVIHGTLISQNPYFKTTLVPKKNVENLEFVDPIPWIAKVLNVSESNVIQSPTISEFGVRFFKILGGYNCPYCYRKHTSKEVCISKSGKFSCSYFYSTEWEQFLYLDRKEIENEKEMEVPVCVTPFIQKILEAPNLKITFSADIQFEQKYLDNSFTHFMEGKNIFIKSAPGTGKSTVLKKWIKGIWAKKRILYLSIRCTFTQNLLSNMNKYGIEFVSYQDIEGNINPVQFPRLICQIESVE